MKPLTLTTLLLAPLAVLHVAGAPIPQTPALILTPPRGMEAGYVPIATRQELDCAASHPREQGKAQQ